MSGRSSSTGPSIEAEVLESLPAGDDRCRFAIHPTANVIAGSTTGPKRDPVPPSPSGAGHFGLGGCYFGAAGDAGGGGGSDPTSN